MLQFYAADLIHIITINQLTEQLNDLLLQWLTHPPTDWLTDWPTSETNK